MPKRQILPRRLGALDDDISMECACSMRVNSGDWVRSYSKGIWQVMREVPQHFAPRYSIAAPLELAPEAIFVLKRLVDDKWKKAFAVETAQGSLLRPLAKADAAKLARFQVENPRIIAEFEAYEKPVDQILNLPFSLAKKSDFRLFKQTMKQTFAEPLQRGVTSDAILKLVAESPYASGYWQNPRSATLQFVCHNLEIARRHFIYREINIQNF